MIQWQGLGGSIGLMFVLGSVVVFSHIKMYLTCLCGYGDGQKRIVPTLVHFNSTILLPAWFFDRSQKKVINSAVSIVSVVSPVIAMSPSVLSVIEDQQMTLPCVLLAGNPLPERQWLHNYGLVSPRRKLTLFSCLYVMSLFWLKYTWFDTTFYYLKFF